MTIVISSQKMYSLVDNFEARPAESLMKKRRGTTSSISCWFWSLGRERLRQNWRRSRLDVDISVVATTSSLNYSLRLVVTTFTQTRQPERPTSSESPVMESSRGSTSHLRLHHHPAPPGTSWWRTNRITLCRKSCWLCQDIRPHGGVLYWPALWDTWVIWWWCMPETRALTFKDNRIR